MWGAQSHGNFIEPIRRALLSEIPHQIFGYNSPCSAELVPPHRGRVQELLMQFTAHAGLEDVIVEQGQIDEAQQQHQHAIAGTEAYPAQRVL